MEWIREWVVGRRARARATTAARLPARGAWVRDP